MEGKNPDNKNRISRSIEFSFAILTLIFGIVLILIIFYQFLRNINLNQEYISEGYQIMVSAFNPKIFYPEIFIPEGITFLLFSMVLIVILKQQIKENGSEKKQLSYLSFALTICIFVFLMIFLVGHIIAHHYLGKYEILNPLFGLTLLLFVICISFFIFFYVFKIIDGENKRMDENKKPPRKLLDNRVLDFRIVSSFLLTIFIILLFMILVLHNIVPRTSINVYWENDRSPNKVVLPGMNASYNLVLENEGGPLTFTNVIIEMDREGNWSVSSREVIVKPNERKIITFTNHVPLNATEGIYHYDFWLVGMIDEGPKYGHGPIQISTEVTIDMDYFNASQSTSSSIFSHLSGGSYPSTFYLYIISPLTLGIFITWIVLCIIFFKRKNLPQTRNICKN